MILKRITERIGVRQGQIRPQARVELFGDSDGHMAYRQRGQRLQSCSSPWLRAYCPDQKIDADRACCTSEMSEVEEPEVQKRIVHPSVNPLKHPLLQEMQFLE